MLVSVTLGQQLALIPAFLFTVIVVVYAMYSKIQEKWEQIMIPKREFDMIKKDLKKMKNDIKLLKGKKLKGSIDPRWILFIFALVLFYLIFKFQGLLP